MTEAGYPKEVLGYLRPEFTSAAVCYLCSEECTESGGIISAGGGYLARAAMVESEGVFVDVTRPPSPEDVASAFSQIVDMSKATGFRSAEEYTKKAFGRLMPVVA
jgi:3-hydroxyacyl-CoA dehydrogenase/3a,7a,12a-trihydroxy-5b-cholest-24-enoyl-CoA hydratase